MDTWQFECHVLKYKILHLVIGNRDPSLILFLPFKYFSFQKATKPIFFKREPPHIYLLHIF